MVFKLKSFINLTFFFILFLIKKIFDSIFFLVIKKSEYLVYAIKIFFYFIRRIVKK